MNLWQMLMARRGLMDVAEAHERGGAGGGAPAGDNEQSIQDPGKQGEQKEQPKGDDDEYAGMTQEELLAELRKSKKAGADLLKENMKRKEKERTLADQLAQYGDIDPTRARQLLEAEQAAETARREAEQAELERRGEFDAVKKQMSEATFIDVNDTITEGAATFSEHVAKLRILAGDVDVDKFLATTMSDTNNQLAIQVRQKVKGLARAFRRNLILGDSSTNTKAFDGIPKLMHDDQKIDIEGASMTFSMFDELVDAVKDLGADCIMMRSEHLRAYRALLRTVNIGPSEIMMENFGRPMLCHNGVPFIVNDFIPTDAGKASIYCLHLSEENGVTGLYGGENAGIVVENIGTVQNKDATRIGLAQIADVMPQVSAAMDKAQGNISSGDTVRIIFGVATILVAAFIAWSQVRKHQKGLV